MDKTNKSGRHGVKKPLHGVKPVIKTETEDFRVSVERSSRATWEGAAFYKEKLYVLLEKPQRFRKFNWHSPLCLSPSPLFGYLLAIQF